jgi:hypothetical protein
MAWRHLFVTAGAAFGLRAFRTEKMAKPRRAPHQLARRGQLESFGYGFFGFLHKYWGANLVGCIRPPLFAVRAPKPMGDTAPPRAQDARVDNRGSIAMRSARARVNGIHGAPDP